MLGLIIFGLFVFIILIVYYTNKNKKTIYTNHTVDGNTSNIVNLVVYCKDQYGNDLQNVFISFGQYANPSIGTTNLKGEAYFSVDNTVDNFVSFGEFNENFEPKSYSTKNLNNNEVITSIKK